MARYAFERLIEAPAQECFDLFTDLERVQGCMSEVVEMKKTNDMGFEPGLTFTCTRLMMGKTHTELMEVTEVEPGSSYTMVCDSCGARWTTVHSFTPDSGGTLVRVDMWSESLTLLAKLISPVLSVIFSGMVRKSINKDLDELKAACEQGSGRPASE